MGFFDAESIAPNTAFRVSSTVDEVPFRTACVRFLSSSRLQVLFRTDGVMGAQMRLSGLPSLLALVALAGVAMVRLMVRLLA